VKDQIMKTSKHSCKTVVAASAVPGSRTSAARPWAQAMLDVLQRRGRTYGLLALYEESRLNAPRWNADAIGMMANAVQDLSRHPAPWQFYIWSFRWHGSDATTFAAGQRSSGYLVSRWRSVPRRYLIRVKAVR